MWSVIGQIFALKEKPVAPTASPCVTHGFSVTVTVTVTGYLF
jgi:hypothetical protein